MCMEDIRLGREGTLRSGTVTLGTSRTVLVPYNRHRTALVLGSPSAGTVYLTASPSEGATEGVALVAGAQTLALDIHRFGAIVTGPIYAAASVAGTTIGYLEYILPKE